MGHASSSHNRGLITFPQITWRSDFASHAARSAATVETQSTHADWLALPDRVFARRPTMSRINALGGDRDPQYVGMVSRWGA